jgi:glucokinase
MESRIVIGIDLGGTEIKSASLRFPDGECLHRETAPTRDGESEGGGPAFLAEAAKLVALHEEKAGVKVDCIGVSAPGLTTPGGDAIGFMPGRLQGLEDLVWADGLDRPHLVPVLNDAHAALLGEIWLGAAKGIDDVVMFTLGTGVGGAIVSGGQLLKGRYRRAGHLGHMSVDFTGAPDICGTPGSIEDAIGNCTVAQRSHGRFQSTKVLLEAHAAGDTDATLIWHSSLRALAAAIVSIANAVDPEVVVLGGGIVSAGDLLFDPLREMVAEREWRPADAKIEIRMAELGTWAGAYGAAYHASKTHSS